MIRQQIFTQVLPIEKRIKMIRQVEKSAKHLKDAIEQALNELGADLSQVDVTILSNGGIFKNAKVKVALKDGVEITKSTDNKVETKAVETTNNVQQEITQPTIETNEETLVEENKNLDSNDSVVEKEQPIDIESTIEPIQAVIIQETKINNDTTNHSDKHNVAKLNSDSTHSNNNSSLTNRDNKESNHRRNFADKPLHRDTPVLRTRPNTPPITSPVGDYVGQIVKLMGVENAEIHCYSEEKYLDIFIDTDDTTIIGPRGETLDAIEMLASIFANSTNANNHHNDRNESKFTRVMVDTQGFRAARIQTLTELARKMADKAVSSGRKIFLEPMADLQRKIIHSVLSTDDRIKTRSEGDGMTRHVVIMPKRNI